MLLKAIKYSSIVALCSCAMSVFAAGPITGIVDPMKLESTYIRSHIQHKKVIYQEGITYIVGTIDGKQVVSVLSGMGKTNVSAVTASMIRDFHPKRIFLSGIAGGVDPRLDVNAVVVANETFDVDLYKLTPHDLAYYGFKHYYINPFDGEQIPKVFKLDKGLRTQLKKKLSGLKSPKVVMGKVASSDVLFNPSQQVKLLQENNVQAADMESSAFMQTCWLFGVQCIVVRGISNKDLHSVEKKAMDSSANMAAKVTLYLISHLSE